MRITRPARFAAVAMLALAAACSDSPVEPKSDPVDLPTALGELSMPAVEAAGASIGLIVPSSSVGQAGCPFDSGSQSFVCAPVVASGLTMKNSYALLTAAGTPQSAFDQATTDAVRVTSSVVGTLTDASGAMSVDDQRTTTLSGLLSGHHVIDGAGTTRVTGTVSGLNLDETITTTIVGLLPPLKGGNGYPRGGTITTTIADATRAVLSSSSVTMTMTFNGTSRVAVTISTAGMTQHCTMDLASSSAGMSCS